MSRFKTSKYRNAFSYVYKKEFWINDLNVGSNLNSNGNHIKASCDFIAFNHDSSSIGSITVLPLGSHGRFTNFPQVAGHSGFVTDFDFSPFHDNLLVTGAEDRLIKLWQLPEEGFSGVCSTAAATLGPFEARVESLLFHPAADNVLGVAAGNTVKIWDIEKQAEKYVLGGHEDSVQSLSWHGDGSLLATICKDGREKKMRLFDPRAGKCTGEVKVHSSLKDSRVLWLGDSNFLLSAGFGITREVEMMLWDIQNMAKPLSRQSLGTATGSPMLFYDEDSKMVFIAMKSESTILFYELTDKSPYLSQGPHIYRGETAQKGMAMVPKRVVEVSSCQITRFHLLTANSVVPVGYHVQRKVHSDFHGDLFPDTAGGVPAMTAQEWFDGSNKKVAKESLNPTKRKQPEPPPVKEEEQVEPDGPTGTTSPSSTSTEPPSGRMSQLSTEDAAEARTPSPKVLNLVRSSRFRHIGGKTMHRSTHIDKVPKLHTTVPGDSNAFQANKDRVAAVLAVAGGQIGVFELSKPGRLDTDNIPTLQNTANVMDFIFDPFNNRRLAVACDDARIRVWNIPEGGLRETLTEPEFYLIGHHEKPNVLAFHPQANSLLASAGYDGKLLIWNIEKKTIEITLEPLADPLFSMAWSPDGRQLATAGKDHVIRIYNPRDSTRPISEGAGPEGSRGARVVWLDNKHIVITGFTRTSVRTLNLYDTRDLSKPTSVIATNVSPATLVPYYDPDTCLLFLSGKGDSRVMVYEYAEDLEPYLHEVNPFPCGSPHQGIGFLPKTLCDVKQVEIARAVRLCKTSVEPIFFVVPRNKPQYFQDDIYCDTKVVWEPALSAEEWLGGKDATQRCVSLCPEGMKLLSEAPKPAPAAKKFASYNKDYKTDEEKKEELMSAMIDKMGEKDDDPLPQTTMDGCDSDEWSD